MKSFGSMLSTVAALSAIDSFPIFPTTCITSSIPSELMIYSTAIISLLSLRQSIIQCQNPNQSNKNIHGLNPSGASPNFKNRHRIQSNQNQNVRFRLKQKQSRCSEKSFPFIQSLLIQSETNHSLNHSLIHSYTIIHSNNQFNHYSLNFTSILAFSHFPPLTIVARLVVLFSELSDQQFSSKQYHQPMRGASRKGVFFTLSS